VRVEIYMLTTLFYSPIKFTLFIVWVIIVNKLISCNDIYYLQLRFYA